MNELKHTPGPWGIAGGYHLISNCGTQIATLSKGDDFEAEQQANAQLIVTSPDLLHENEVAVGSINTLIHRYAGAEQLYDDDIESLENELRLIVLNLENVARKARGGDQC